MEREGVDWWYVTVIALVAVVSVGDIVVPALLVRPVVALSDRMSAGEDEGPVGPIPRVPSKAWPIGFALLGLVAVGVAVARMISERQVEGRWLWLLAAAGMTVLWSCGVVAAVNKAEKALGQMSGSL